MSSSAADLATRKPLTEPREEHDMTYQEYAALEANGTPAQAVVGSITRGGFTLGDSFYFVSTRREKVPLASVMDLKIHTTA